MMATHSPSCVTSVSVETPDSCRLALTASTCESRIPERIRWPQVTDKREGNSATITSAVRFAHTRSADAVASSSVPMRKVMCSETPFTRALSCAIVIASASVSQASICASGKSFAAAIARMRYQFPIEKTSAGKIFFDSRQTQACRLVRARPNAIPGSMRITKRPCASGISAQGGAMIKRSPISTGCQLFHSPSQSGSNTSRTVVSRAEDDGS